MKCLVYLESAWIYSVFQINGTSEISTCKHFSHLFEVNFSETDLMASAENSILDPHSKFKS